LQRCYREGVGTGEGKNGGEVAGEEAVVPRGGCAPAVPLLTPPQPQRKSVRIARARSRMAGSLGPEGSLYLFSKGAAVLELYEILQVSPKAEPEVIQAAYKALARKYHPDHHPDKALAQQKMIRINEAYEVLGDPERRRRYDAGLEGPRRIAPPAYDGKRYGRARVVDGKGKEHDVTVLEMDLSKARVRAFGALRGEGLKLVLSLGLAEAPVTIGVRSAEGRGEEWTLRFEPLGAALPRVVAYLEKAG